MNIKEKFREKMLKTANWCRDNKEMLAVVIPVVGYVVGNTARAARSVSKNVSLMQEKKLKERYIYDRSLGVYLELKRPLKQREVVKILERKENGERLAGILSDYKLLK